MKKTMNGVEKMKTKMEMTRPLKTAAPPFCGDPPAYIIFPLKVTD